MPASADINFMSSIQMTNYRRQDRRLTQAGMWETNTSEASFHARLNVAAPRAFGNRQKPVGM
jgi:hypothetical protein